MAQATARGSTAAKENEKKRDTFSIGLASQCGNYDSEECNS
jgi:hypothetical protein